jgi:hypothetical protein
MDLAKEGHEYARLVLAHEIGHIILHDHDAKPFSSNPSLRINYDQEGYSAEWQAQTFAAYFLLPDHIVLSFTHEEQITELCGVHIDLARERFYSVYPPNRKIERDFCFDCGECTMERLGLRLRCTNCGVRRR